MLAFNRAILLITIVKGLLNTDWLNGTEMVNQFYFRIIVLTVVDGSEKHWLNFNHFGWLWGTSFQCKKDIVLITLPVLQTIVYHLLQMRDGIPIFILSAGLFQFGVPRDENFS